MANKALCVEQPLPQLGFQEYPIVVVHHDPIEYDDGAVENFTVQLGVSGHSFETRDQAHAYADGAHTALRLVGFRATIVDRDERFRP